MNTETNKLNEYVVKKLTCRRCGHQWWPRGINGINKSDQKYKKPKVCPTCKSPYWDQPYKRKHKRREQQ